MKRLIAILFIIAVSVVSCIKNDPVTSTIPLVEFDITSWNANAAGVDYPLLVQAPSQFGRVVVVENSNCNAAGVDPFVTRNSGTVRYRVNMIGATAKAEREISVSTFNVPFTTVSFRKRGTPSCALNTLTLQQAVEGTHFSLASNRIKIPADSSYGYLVINVLDTNAVAGIGRVIGLKLDSAGSLLPNVNYRRLAVVIDQR